MWNKKVLNKYLCMAVGTVIAILYFSTGHMDTFKWKIFSTATPHHHPGYYSNSPSSPVRHCRTQERLATINQYCKREYPSGPQFPVKDNAVRTFVQDLNVDEVNKVIVCVHQKVASSTWTRILAKNVLDEGVDFESMDPPFNIHKVDWRNMNIIDGLTHLHHERYSKSDIMHRLQTYYKIMVVRHPFDRLESFYNDIIMLFASHEDTTFGIV